MKQHYLKSWVKLFVLALMLFSSGLTMAQTTITGRVADADNQPVAGATVSVPGTTAGAGTASDGSYKVNAPAGATQLAVSAIGYIRQTALIGGRTTINFTIKSTISNLNEIVVTGYTSQRKGDITGAVSVVSAKEVAATPTANVASALQGRVPGVVVGVDPTPGGNVDIRIRGLGTFGSNSPLIIVDGVQLSGGTQDINPADIESVQVLKDASAAAIYGARAANGVVILTTRKGKSGKTQINFDSYAGVSVANAHSFPHLLNTQQEANFLWKDIANEAAAAGTTPVYNDPIFGSGATPVIPQYLVAGSTVGAAVTPAQSNPALYNYTPLNAGTFYQITKTNQQGTDWFKTIFHTAPIQSYSVAASGGTNTSHFLFSTNYLNQQGALKYTFYDRYGFRVNSDFQVKKHIRIGENITYTFSENQGIGDAGEGTPVAEAYRINAYIPVYDIAGNFAGTRSVGGNAANPLAILKRASANIYGNSRMIGNAFLDFDVVKGLSAKSSIGVDYGNYNGSSFQVPNQEQNEGNSNTQVFVDNSHQYQWTWTNTLNYKNVFKGGHSLNILAGTEAVNNKYRYFSATRQTYAFINDPNYRYLSAGAGAQSNGSGQNDGSFFSYFGRVSYSYKERYLLDATIRRDGSSYFGTQKYGNFPGVSLGWRLSQEEFMKNITWITDLKLRAGYGIAGNSNIPAYNAYTQYHSATTDNTYSITGSPNQAAPGYSINQYGNANTKWERDETLNGGFDGTFFNNKLEVVLDLYSKKSSGLLYNPGNPTDIGSGSPPYQNIGTMSNKGFDLGVIYNGASSDNKFKYSAGISLSHYKNLVQKLDANSTDYVEGGTNPRLANVTRTQAGRSVGEFFGYKVIGIFQNQAAATAAPDQSALGLANTVGTFQFADVNHDGKIDASDRTFIGDPNPKLTGGLNITASYGGFDLLAFFQGVTGNKLFNINKYYTDFQTFVGNYSTAALYNSWTPTNPGATLPIINSKYTATESIASSYYVENGDYLRLKNMQIGYTLPKKLMEKIGIERLRVYIQGTNLFTLTKYKGLDPDVTIHEYSNYNNPVNRVDLTRGVDYGGYPNVRQFIFGVNLTL